MRIGDVLLVTGQGKVSTALVTAQKALYQRAVSSHVAFCLGDGCFVHATGDSGVHLVFITEELKNCEPEWRAIRLKGITDEQEDRLVAAGLYYLRQGYNKGFMGAGTDHSSFCSELVAKIYEKAGIPILSNRSPSKVAPAHFDLEADSQTDWEDVTEEYKAPLAEIEKDPRLYHIAFSTIQAAMARRHVFSQGREQIFNWMLQEADRNGDTQKRAMVEEMKETLRKQRSLHFWDEHDQD